MKKISKVFLSLALVLVMVVPMLTMTGCDLSDLFGGNKDKTNLELHTTFKTEYYVGETLNVDNGKIKYTDKDGTSTIISITTNMITSFNTDTVGERQMILTYNEKQVLIDYSVFKVYDIEISALYYCNPTILASTYNGDLSQYYDYVTFINGTTVKVCSTKTTPAYFEWGVDETELSYTTEIVNHQKIYNFSDGICTGKITVTGEGTFTFEITATDLCLSATFVKF